MTCLPVELAEVEAARELPASDWHSGMSNFDNEIMPDAEKRLANGESIRHAAWEFNGLVVQAPDGQFVEWVHRYQTVVCMHTAPTLRELMNDVNDAHGWD